MMLFHEVVRLFEECRWDRSFLRTFAELVQPNPDDRLATTCDFPQDVFEQLAKFCGAKSIVCKSLASIPPRNEQAVDTLEYTLHHIGKCTSLCDGFVDYLAEVRVELGEEEDNSYYLHHDIANALEQHFERHYPQLADFVSDDLNPHHLADMSLIVMGMGTIMMLLKHGKNDEAEWLKNLLGVCKHCLPVAVRESDKALIVFTA